jgi:hypothetical protein
MSGCRVFLKPLLEATATAKAEGSSSSSGVTLEGVDGFDIERVLFDDEKKKTRAIGAIGTLDIGEEGGKVRLVVLADRTVISAGTMNSPAILLRSGLKVSGDGTRGSASQPPMLIICCCCWCSPGRTQTLAKTSTSTRP